MALVICPECGSKISQYADICNQCGFPLQKYLEKNKITDLTKTLICPKCGGYDYICEFTEDNSIYIACKYCHIPYVQTELDATAFEKNSLHEWQKGNKDFEADMAKKYGNGEFDEDAYRHRKEIIAKPLSGEPSFKVDDNSICSMNMFLFTPYIFKILDREIIKYFTDNKDNLLDGEFLIPDVVEDCVRKGEVKVKLMKTTSKWYGVTYKEDASYVKDNINKMITNGIYPNNLW